MSTAIEAVRGLLATSQDLCASLALLDPDVEWIPLRAGTEGAYRGHEGFRRFVADTWEAFEDYEPSFELEELPDGRVLAWGTVRVRGRGSGAETDVPVGGLFEVREGKVSRWEDFGSRERALAAAGP